MSYWETKDPQWCGDPSDGAGVYVYYLDGVPSYIGSTRGLFHRLRAHNVRPTYSTGYFTPWGKFENVTLKIKRPRRMGDWLMDEYRLIKRLRPRYNSIGLGRRLTKKHNEFGIVTGMSQ
jgi:hypothetical protein